MEAFRAQRYDDAIDLFQRAETLVHSPIHLLFLGRAFAARGHLVRAQEALLKASREQLDAGSPASRVRAVEDASKELDQIRPRLAELTVTVTGAGDAPALTLDGTNVAAVLVGVPMPVDPGAHRIEAKATGYLPAWRNITLIEGQRQKIELTLVADPNAPEPTKAEPTTEDKTAGNSATPAASSGRSPVLLVSAIGGFVLAAAGGSIGTYEALRGNAYKKRSDDFANLCGLACKDNAEVQRLEANKHYSAAIVPFIVGGAGLAAGGTLLLFYLADGDSKDQAQLQPWLGLNSVGVRGTF
jgi:hypothetical protein